MFNITVCAVQPKTLPKMMLHSGSDESTVCPLSLPH